MLEKSNQGERCFIDKSIMYNNKRQHKDEYLNYPIITKKLELNHVVKFNATWKGVWRHIIH